MVIGFLMLILMAYFLGLCLLALVLPVLGVALNVIVGLIAAGNLLALAFCLVVWRLWKRSGRMDRTYIDGLEGWRRWALLAGRWVLWLAAAWAALCLLACGWYFIFRPVDLLVSVIGLTPLMG